MSSSMVSKVSTHRRVFYSVRMKRSATPSFVTLSR